MTRPIGRLCSEASPVKVVKNGCGARMPIMRRSVVPELPASMIVEASRSPCRPWPQTTRDVSDSNSTEAPSAFMQAAVERQSCACRKFVMCTGVEPSAENMTLRCEMDLSPGISIVPRNPCLAFAIVFVFSIEVPPLHSSIILQ